MNPSQVGHDHPILGREWELAEVETFLVGFQEFSAALIIEGEAGIGKTILWEAAVRRARDRGIRTLACQPTGAEVALSYSSLSDLLAEIEPEAIDGLPIPQSIAIRVATLRQAPVDHPVDQRAIAAGFLGIIRAASSVQPVLLAFDDLQWLDGASARVVSYALRRLSDRPIGTIGTLRIGPGFSDPIGLANAIRGPGTATLTLGPLPFPAIEAIVRQRFAKGLLRAVARRVYAGSGGNPFFAIELARSVLERGVRPADGQPLPIPASVEELLRDRLRGLRGPAREVLMVAAASGGSLKQVQDAVPHLDVTGSLEEAVKAGLVEIRDLQIRFTHPLLASVCYRRGPKAQRRAVHARLASTVTNPEERARHLALSVVGTNPSVAAALDLGARHARLRGAAITAAELCHLAVRLTPEEDVEDRLRRRLEFADLTFLAGDTHRAIVLLEAFVRSSPTGSWRGLGLTKLGAYTFFAGQPHPRRLLDAARREPGLPVDIRAVAHIRTAFLSHYEGDFRSSARHGRAAVALAERSGEPSILIDALIAASLGPTCMGAGTESETMLRALRMQGAHDPLLIVERADWAYACTLEWAGRHEDALLIMEPLLVSAMEHGDEHSLSEANWHIANNLFQLGDWDRAMEHAEAAVRASERLGPPWRELALVGRLRAARGQVDIARSMARDALAGGDTLGETRSVIEALSVLGFIEVSLDRPALAVGPLLRAWALLIDTGAREPLLYPLFVPDAVEALVATGRAPEAATMATWLDSRGRELERPLALALAARCRGLLAVAAGASDRGIEELTAAMAFHEEVPRPFERARTLLALGSTLRQAGRLEAARDPLEAAASIFGSLGAVLWSAKARAEVDRLGGRTEMGSLSPGEIRVAKLAGAGRTNREIAETLFLSVRTVEGHLARTYSKLGLRSRTELAVFMSDDETPES